MNNQKKALLVALAVAGVSISGPMVKWSRRGPLTPQTGVRLSLGSPALAPTSVGAGQK